MATKLLNLKKPIIVFLLLIAFPFISYSQIQTYTAPGEYTFLVPAGVTQIEVEAWGGGGRGQSFGTGGDKGIGGGGGGGAFAKKNLFTVVPGTSYTVIVGDGSSSTSAGLDSEFFLTATPSTKIILAKGGLSATSSTGVGTGVGSIGDVVYQGGSGATGSGSNAGGGGSSAGNAAIGVNAIGSLGGIAPAGGGNGGNGRSGIDGDGIGGFSPGGGGGGALRIGNGGPARTGGNGANGKVIIKYPSPEIDIHGNGISIVDGSTTPTTGNWTDFGSTSTSVAVTRIFTIYNTGEENLTIGAITFSGTNALDFSVTTAPTSPILPGGSTTFVVRFLPSANGTSNATINIVNNDLNEDPYNFSLRGEGIYIPPQYTAYYENFDTSTGGWTPVTSTNDSWIRTNTFNNTTEMGEGSFWRNLNYNDYQINTNIVIESPAYDFTNLNNILFSIDIKYNTENNIDGMRILYSISGGAYTLLGSSGTGTNWYQDNVSVLSSEAWNGDGHAQDPTFTPHSQFGRSSIPLSNALFSNVNNVRFRIEFSSNGNFNYDGVAFDNVLIEADPLAPLNEATIAPANITSNLRLWLKTNEGIAVSDGANLTNWEDQAYDTALDKEDAYADNSLAPIYRDNGTRNINFNPVADFDHNNTEYMQGKGGYFSQDYFVVFRSDDEVATETGSFSPGRQIVLGGRLSDDAYHEDPTGLGMGSTSGRFTDEILSHNISSYPSGATADPNDESYGRAYTTTSVTYRNHPLIVNVKSNAARTSTEIYKNGKRVDNTTGTVQKGTELNFNEFNNLQYLIGTGRSGIAGRRTSQLNGMLTEVISYTSPNSAINQQKIQSYLGIKYGVTLQDDASGLVDYRLNDVDYIDSQEAIIWDTGANAGYNYDIAGIGRDDASLLYQKQSRSQNDEFDGSGPTSGFLTIGLGDIYATNNNNPNTLNNREFLVWGNNNADINGTAMTVEPDMSEDIGDPLLETKVLFEAIPRIWKVIEVGGDIPEVEVSIPISAIRTAFPPDGRYLMFISPNGIFDPNADYRVMTEIGGKLYGHYDFDGTEYITFGWAPEREFKRSIYFDPADTNYIDMEDALDLDPNGNGFTVSAWIKRLANSGNTSILSKRDVGYTDGYDFKINGLGKLEMSWGALGVQNIISNTIIPEDEWHQVAIIYSGNIAKLYIDGVLDETATGLSNPANTSSSFFIAAACKNTPEAFFHGNIDEVRIWDIALSEDQLHYIMNQEIINFDIAGTDFVSGKVLPQTVTKNEVITIPWSDLAGYYPMSVYTYTNTKDESGNGHQGALKNLKTVDWQTAPLPYVSKGVSDPPNSLDASLDWDTTSTWTNGDVQTIPGSASIVDANTTVDWNIVQISSNLTMNNTALPAPNYGNRSVLGLIVDDTFELTAEGTTTMSDGTDAGNGITVTHYLGLDGKIDLEGGSQLIQTADSDLITNANGEVERDQQGTASSYNYNYWSSSVSPKAAGNTNSSYTIEEVLFDGSTANPSAITYLSPYAAADGNTPPPLIISRYWLWKFHGVSDDYNAWGPMVETTTMLPGEGFTMKGVSGASANTDNFNYTFVGKPYNGDFTIPITPGFDRLIGNPYPSALDADEFIKDNISIADGGRAGANIFNGALYYWHHFAKTNHNLAAYVGGYATYTLMGGVQAFSSDARINATGASGGRVPERYIPVNQGFFVNAIIDPSLANSIQNPSIVSGGNIQFKNSQRVFELERETLTNSGSQFFKGSASKNTKKQTIKGNTDPRRKIRLKFNSPQGYYRQLLVGVDENTTNNFDIGYDALLADLGDEDMFWIFDGAKFVIQGVNNFNKDQELQLGITISETGVVSIKIDELENIDESLELYIKDNLDGETYNITQNAFEINLEAGEYLDRFMLVFKPRLKTLQEVSLTEGIHTFMNNAISELQIKRIVDTKIESIYLYNYLGQLMNSWKSNLEETELYLPINATTGVYFVQINTSDGAFNKKIIKE